MAIKVGSGCLWLISVLVVAFIIAVVVQTTENNTTPTRTQGDRIARQPEYINYRSAYESAAIAQGKSRPILKIGDNTGSIGHLEGAFVMQQILGPDTCLIREDDPD